MLVSVHAHAYHLLRMIGSSVCLAIAAFGAWLGDLQTFTAATNTACNHEYLRTILNTLISASELWP